VLPELFKSQNVSLIGGQLVKNTFQALYSDMYWWCNDSLATHSAMVILLRTSCFKTMNKTTTCGTSSDVSNLHGCCFLLVKIFS